MFDTGLQSRLVAIGNISADGTVAKAKGCALTRNAVGQYRITLDRELANASMVMLASPRGAPANSYTVCSSITNSIKTVNALVVNVLTDMAVDVAVFDVGSPEGG